MRAKRLAVLGIAIALCLGGCKGKDVTAPEDTQSDNTGVAAVSDDSAVSEEPVSEDEPDEKAGGEVTEDPGTDEKVEDNTEKTLDTGVRTPVLYTTDNLYDYYSEEGEGYTYAYISGAYPWVLSEGYDELKTALKEQNTKDWSGMRSTLEDTEDTVTETSKENQEYLVGTMPWYTLQDTEMVRSDDLIFSYWFETESWMGGAHPYGYKSGRNFDTATGKLLELKDIATDYDGLYELVLEKLENTENTDYFYDEWKDTVHSLFYDEDYSLEWTISYDTIDFYFNSYSLMPYAGGPVNLPIKLAECTDLIDSTYSGGVSDRLFHYMTWDDYDNDDACYRFEYDSDGDGEKDMSLSVREDRHYNEEYEYFDYTDMTITLAKNGKESSYSTQLWSSYIGSWIIEDGNGDYYLYMEELSDNDWHVLNIFDLNGDSIKSLDMNSSGAFYNMTNQTADHIFVTTRVYIMGTHSAVTECEIGRAGQLISKDGEYRLTHISSSVAVDEEVLKNSYSGLPGEEYNVSLTAKEDISDVIYYSDIDDRDNGETSTIAKGTQLIPYLTDGKKYMIFKVKDGDGYYRVDYDSEDEHLIHGEQDTDLFDGIMYAG
ncbi:MAG: DUF3298 domain-containing protein [Lachnospiraceae bacterium]|nr:DUF3298 domain-containing protein [Lachnospiraceae bacterium]